METYMGTIGSISEIGSSNIRSSLGERSIELAPPAPDDLPRGAGGEQSGINVSGLRVQRVAFRAILDISEHPISFGRSGRSMKLLYGP